MEERYNREALDHIFAAGQMNLRRGGLFRWILAPLAPDFDFEGIEGMMLGLAIAD